MAANVGNPEIELRIFGNMLMAMVTLDIDGEKRMAGTGAPLSTMIGDALSKASRQEALEIADALVVCIAMAKLRANNLDAHRMDKLAEEVLDQLGY